ncbi:hypothetical protein ABC502_09125 [Alkalimonas sp. NCh-2]|uniref:hypothetical protein n=1 Tax=Alkalimonas sp. NCh-2 TaxID=3144846 RepID=UPI0031F6E2E8
MNKFIVIGLGGKPVGCQIVPDQARFTMNYGIAFGPASFSECQQWLKDNCTPLESTLDSYVVIAPIAGSDSCKVIHENESYLMTYTLVFGPASKEECEHWVKESCH